MREVLYYKIHCPLIIQKDLDLWKLDFSFLILLYRKRVTFITLVHCVCSFNFFDASQLVKKNCLCTLSME